MFLCRWKHDQLVAEFWLKLLSLFTKAQGKAETVLCSFPLPNWSQYLLTTSLSKVHTVLNAYPVYFAWLGQLIWTLTLSSIMNSIMRLILRGKGISISAEKVPKSSRNMASLIHSVCTGKSRAAGQGSENSSNASISLGGRKRQDTCWKLPLPPAKVPAGSAGLVPPFLAGQPQAEEGVPAVGQTHRFSYWPICHGSPRIRGLLLQQQVLLLVWGEEKLVFAV